MRRCQLLLVVVLVTGLSCGRAATGDRHVQDAAIVSSVLLRVEDLPDDWAPCCPVRTLRPSELQVSPTCMPGMQGHGYEYGVYRLFTYRVDANGREAGGATAYARLTATATDNQRILDRASSKTNEACLRQEPIDDLNEYVPQSGGRITGPATIDSTTAPFPLPLTGNFFRMHVPYTLFGSNWVLTYDVMRIQQGRLSASFEFRTCCMTAAFGDSEAQAVDRVASRLALANATQDNLRRPGA